MNLIKASVYSALSTIVRILSGLVVVKVVAIYVGPQGLGKMGQFMSLMTIMSVLAGGGIGNGVIKYVAEHKQNEVELKSFLGCGVTYTIFCAIIMTCLGAIFSRPLAAFLLGSENYASLIIILAISQFLIAANNFLVAIVNGYKDVKRLTYLNITGSLVGLLLLLVLVRYYNLYGGLLGLIAMQAVLFFVSAAYVRKAEWFKLSYFRVIFSKDQFIKLARFSSMAITTAIATPIAQIIIRDYIQHAMSWSEVGYWQGVTRISDVYLLFITTTLTVYYLPRLSEIKDRLELREEILKAYKIMVPSVIILAGIVYLSRNFVVQLLFSSGFSPMENLFAFQLIGDVIKISAWLLSFIMLAKAMTKTFIVTEIIFNATFVLLVFIFVHYFGLMGTTYAFALNCFMYLITMIFLFGRLISEKRVVCLE